MDPLEEAARQWNDHGWQRATLGMSVVTSIVRAAQLLSRRVDRVLAPSGLTFARFEILRLLAFARSGELPIGRMSERLQVHGTSVTSAVERLIGQGFVSRRRDDRDGRVVLVRITEEGRDVVEEATVVLNREIFESLGLADSRLSELLDALRDLRVAEGDL